MLSGTSGRPARFSFLLKDENWKQNFKDSVYVLGWNVGRFVDSNNAWISLFWIC